MALQGPLGEIPAVGQFGLIKVFHGHVDLPRGCNEHGVMMAGEAWENWGHRRWENRWYLSFYSVSYASIKVTTDTLKQNLFGLQNVRNFASFSDIYRGQNDVYS
jgi:hypothetical protein